MPIYVFKCENCNEEREVIRSFSAMEDPEYCHKDSCREPSSNGEAKTQPSIMKRVSFPGGTSAHFGKGFFKTGGY